MFYLLGSVFLFALNNVLWAHYAPKVPPFRLIAQRAVFTVSFLGGILGVLAMATSTKLHFNDALELTTIGLAGLAGIIFLVLGFRYGTILQFSIYSLLLTFVVALIGNKTNSLSISDQLSPLILVSFGYLHFIWVQFRKGKSKNLYLAHLFFMLAHFFLGSLLFLQWQYLSSISALEIAFSQELVVLVFTGIIWRLIPKKTTLHRSLTWKESAVFALPISLAVLLGLEGLKSTHPFHSALIALLTPVFTLLFGVLAGKQVLTVKAMIGPALMVLGLSWFYF